MIRRSSSGLDALSVLGGVGHTNVGDAGIDMNVAVKAVNGMKPMRADQARRLAMLSITALNLANQADAMDVARETSGARARRSDLVRQLGNMDASIASSHLDPLPETAAAILREVALKAIVEFNSAAEVAPTLLAARERFFEDIVENAKELARKAGEIAGEIAWYAKATTWAVIGGVLLVGYGGYRLLSSEYGHRMARRYL